jgi:hypothetical protein
MTKTEVETALSKYDLIFQVKYDHEFEGPGAADVTSFTTPWFDDFELEQRLNLVLGYDSEDKFMLLGREEYVSTVGRSYSRIECPLSFR